MNFCLTSLFVRISNCWAMFKISSNRYLKILLHLVLWGLLFLLFLWILNYRFIYANRISGDAQMVVRRIFGYRQLLVTVFMLAGIFYLNYYLLIPRYLSQKKFKKYAGSIVAVLLVAFGISYFNRPTPPDFLANRQPSFVKNFKEFGGSERRELPGRPIFLSLGDLLLGTIAFAVSTSIRGTREWFINEKQLKEIENQKLTAELSFLKAQINPHFFFNTLNGIYALARQKSDHTPDVILKLSDLMRYIIYEADTSKVLLSREIAHIENYIELQKIRLNEIVQVKFEVIGNPGIVQIEPLLFSVFLENAFKHGIDYTKPGTIDIKLSVLDDGLTFVVKNPIPNHNKVETDEEVGIGLKNIRQRLDLVYPKRHQLKIYQLNGQHIIELYLNIEE